MSLFSRPSVQSYVRSDRVQQYGRFKRLYDGLLVRSNLALTEQQKRVVFNFAQPIANISAAFLAGKPLSFEHSGGKTEDDTLTQEMAAIWTRSGSDQKFLEAARLGAIQGDSCLKVEETEDGKYRLRWMDAAICFPEFDPHDCEKLTGMVIAYEVAGLQGGTRAYMESWRDGVVTIDDGDNPTETKTYDEKLWGGGPPFVWIPNERMLGECFGRSDLQCLVDLIERFDHTATKQDQIVDYYAHPNIVFRGISKPTNGKFDNKIGNAFFVPADGDVFFVEWKGNAPAVGEDLERLRDAISEVSETPRIAFGKTDSGVTQLSGVALKVLYAPLLAKTQRKQASYGPGLERALFIALAASGKKVDPTAISVDWPNPLPGDELADLKALQIKSTWLSDEQILREMEYTPEEIVQNLAERQAQKKADVAIEQGSNAPAGFKPKA